MRLLRMDWHERAGAVWDFLGAVAFVAGYCFAMALAGTAVGMLILAAAG